MEWTQVYQKTLVKHLVAYVASITDNEKVAEALRDIVETPISPELTPADKEGKIQQKTEDFVGPYELNDFFLYYFYDTVSSLLRYFSLQNTPLKVNIAMLK